MAFGIDDEQEEPALQSDGPDMGDSAYAAAEAFARARRPDPRATLQVTGGLAPEAAVQDRKLSENFGLPIDIVRRKRDSLQKGMDLDKWDFDKITTETPVLAKNLADPVISPIIRDDVENMSYWERYKGDFKQAAQTGQDVTTLGNLGAKRAFGQELTPEEQLQYNRAKKRERVDYGIGFMEAAGQDLRDMSWAYSGPGGRPVEGASVNPLAFAADMIGMGGKFAMGVPGAVVEMAPPWIDVGMKTAQSVGPAATGVGAVVTAATRSPMLGLEAAGLLSQRVVPPVMTAFMGRLEFGAAFSEYEDFTDNNGKPIEKEVAAGAAAIVGVVNGLAERYGFDTIAKRFPGGDKMFGKAAGEIVQDLIEVPEVRNIFARVGSAIVDGATTEGATEGFQEFVTSVLGETAKMLSAGEFDAFMADIPEGEEMTDMERAAAFWSNLANRVGESTVRGMQGGAGFATGGEILSIGYDKYQARRAYQREQGQILNDKAKAQESKVRERDPELFKRLLQEQFGEDDKIYLNAEDVSTFFQDEAAPALQDAIEYLPEIEKELRRALREGTDMVLPRSEVIGMLAATDDFDSLIQSMKLSDSVISDREFADYHVQELVEQFEREREGQSDFEQFEEKISGIMQNAGFTPRNAAPVAEMTRKHFETLFKLVEQDGQADKDFIMGEVQKYMDGLMVQHQAMQQQRRKPNQQDFVIDAARRHVKRKAAQAERAAKQETKGSRQGELVKGGKAPKAKRSAPRRILNSIVGSGVRPDSETGRLLQEIGYTTKEYPSLYRKNAKSTGTELDNVPLEDLEFWNQFGLQPQSSDGTYIDRDWLLDVLRDEHLGNLEAKTEKQREREQQEAFYEELDEMASRVGIDLATASNEEVRRVIEDFEASGFDMAAFEDMYAEAEAPLQTFAQSVLGYNESDLPQLVAMHNLTERNLLHADKVGGIAAPSLAIIKGGEKFDNFGEVTLIAPPELIDPRNGRKAKVFGADVYSPRYPSVTYDVPLTSYRAFEKKLDAALKRIEDHYGKEVKGHFVPDIHSIQDRGYRELENSGGVAALYFVENDIDFPDPVSYVDNGELNVSGLLREMRDQVVNDVDYQQFIEGLMQDLVKREVIFNGFTDSGNRRYLPHNLETVVRIMTKTVRDGEGFNYGLGSVRSKFTPQFKSLTAIKKAQDKIVSEEEFNAIKEELDSEFIELGNKLEPYANRKGFMFLDDFSEHLKEIADTNNIPRVLREYYDEPALEMADDIAVFLDKLRAMPTEYFEAKIGRAVDIGEFAGAIVPEDADPRVIDALKKSGISDIQTYKRGDAASRQQAVMHYQPTVFFQSEQAAQGLQSALLREAGSLKQEKGSGDQMLAMLRKQAGVKEEEIAWTGLDDFLQGKKSVTRQEIVDYLNDNQVRVEEVTLGEQPIPDNEIEAVRDLNTWAVDSEGDFKKSLHNVTLGVTKMRDGFRLWVNGGLQDEIFDTAEAAADIAADVASDIGDAPTATKFEQYTLPGGENYREVLLTLPNKALSEQEAREVLGAKEDAVLSEADMQYAANKKAEGFRSQHFDQPNILAHVRLNDRTDADGSRVLFIEEIQSDWHQAGRKKGYKGEQRLPPNTRIKKVTNTVWQIIDENGRVVFGGTPAQVQNYNPSGAVPDAPFKKTWHEMAFRRVAQMAAQQGYDKIAWTTGEQQNERFDLSKQVSRVIWDEEGERLQAIDLDGKPVIEETNVRRENLEDYVGKEIAERLINEPVKKSGLRSLQGDDLKIGGEGMKGFYDKIIPSYAKKFGKKYGAEVQTLRLGGQELSYDDIQTMLGDYDTYPVGSEKREALKKQQETAPDYDHESFRGEVWSLPITNAMRESANKGFELFQGGNRGQIQFFPDGESLITLFENSDPSTIIHELGHFFHQNVERLAALDGAPKKIVELNDRLRKFGGAKDGQPLTRDGYEKIARGFEAYMYEGKAPSAGLREAFATMMAWMKQVYESIRKLDVRLTKDVRDVFDRMLATEQEIEEYRNAPGFKLDQAVMELLTAAEQKKYIASGERMLEDAKERLLKRFLKDMTREETKKWKEEKARLVEENAEQLTETPLYQAVHFLRTGEFLVGEKPDGVPKLKLSRADVAAQLDPEALKYMPSGIFGKEGDAGTIKADIVAELFGFKSAGKLLEALTSYEPIKTKAERMADEEMARRHGDLLKNGDIQEEALKAAHNEVRAQQMERELKAISDRAKIPYPSGSDFKEAARRLIASKLVDEAQKPNQYYSAEVRAARETGKHLANGDYVKAADAKRKQFLNHFMYKESLAARDEVKKTLRRYKKLAKVPKKKKHVEIARPYHEKIWDILDKYNFAPMLSEKRRSRLEAAALAEWIEARQRDDNARLILPQAIIDADTKQHYRELTLSEFRGIRDMVDNLAHAGSMLTKVKAQGKVKEVSEAAKEIVKSIENNIPTRKREVGARGGVKKEAPAVWRSTIALIEKVGTVIEDLDGGKKLGPAYQYLKRNIDEAMPLLGRRLREDVAEPLVALAEKHYGAAKAIEGIKTAFFSDMASRNIYVPELDQKLSKLDILGIAQHQGNVDNKTKFVDGWNAAVESANLTQGMIDAILERHMDARDWAYVQDMWDFIDSFWPEVEAKNYERTGVKIEKVEREGFTAMSSDGQVVNLKGGYFPLKYESRESVRAGQKDIDDLYDLIRTGGPTIAATKNGATIERVKGVKMPPRFDYGVVTQHFNEMMRDLVLGDAIADVSKVLARDNVRKAITATRGAETVRMLEMWLQDIATSGAGANDMVSIVMHRLRTRAGIGHFGFNIAAGFLNWSGYAQSFTELGPKWFLRGFSEAFDGFPNPKRMHEKWQSVINDDIFLQERYRNLSRDLADGLRALEKKGGWSGKFGQAMMIPFMKLQMTVDMPLYMGAYARAVSEGHDHKDAQRYAAQTVADTQVSGFIQDLSAIERGTITQNIRHSEFVKPLTFMYSYMNVKLQVAMRAGRRRGIRGIKDLPKDLKQTALLMGDYIMLFAVEGMIFELMKGRAPDLDDEEDSLLALLWWSMRITGEQILGTLPLAREAASYLKGFTGAPGGLRGVEHVTSAITDTKGIIDGFVNGEDVNGWRYAKTMTRAANYMTPMPLPVTALNNAFEAMSRMDEGEEVTPLNFFMYLPKD